MPVSMTVGMTRLALASIWPRGWGYRGSWRLGWGCMASGPFGDGDSTTEDTEVTEGRRDNGTGRVPLQRASTGRPYASRDGRGERDRETGLRGGGADKVVGEAAGLAARMLERAGEEPAVFAEGVEGGGVERLVFAQVQRD